MKGRLFIYYCLYCLMTPAFCWKFGSFEYDEEVIDFTDMGSYNHGFQKNLNTGRNGLKPPGVVEEENVRIMRYNFKAQQAAESVDEYPDGSVSTKIREVEEEFDVSKDQIKSIEVVEASRSYSEKECPTLDDVTSMKYMKRVVASLLRQMNVQGHVFGPGEAITIDLQAEISHVDFMTLNRFVNTENGDGDKYLSRVDSILSNMLHIVVLPVPTSFFESLKEVLITITDVFLTPRTIITVFVLSVVVFMLSVLVRKIRNARTVYHLISYGFLVIFLVSCVWEFFMMYETAKAENHARILQTTANNIPADCEFETFGLLESFSYYVRVHQFGYEDRCVAYFKQIMVDPFWEVSPTAAISQSFARLVFHPAEYIGGKVGSFFYKATRVFPIFFQPFVLLLLFFFVFMGIFGFKVKTPFLSIEAPGFGVGGGGGGGDNRRDGQNMLPQPDPGQQIAEKPAAEVVRVKTRDACVDTSDFEEYLRACSAAEEEKKRERLRTPELPSIESFTLHYPFLERFSCVFKVCRSVAMVIARFLDRLLRSVPFGSSGERAPFSVD